MISEQDIDGMLNSPFYKELFSDEYRVGHIMLSVDEQGGNSAQEQAAARAAVIMTLLNKARNFPKLRWQNHHRVVRWKAVIWDGVRQRHYQACFSETVLDMTIGEVSVDNRTWSVHIIVTR